MKRDALQHPTQVRLSKGLKDRLDSAAVRFGLTASEVIRRAVEWQLPKWESSGEFLIRSEQSPAPVQTDAHRRARRAVALTIAAGLFALLAGSRPVDQSNEWPSMTISTIRTNTVICCDE